MHSKNHYVQQTKTKMTTTLTNNLWIQKMIRYDGPRRLQQRCLRMENRPTEHINRSRTLLINVRCSLKATSRVSNNPILINRWHLCIGRYSLFCEPGEMMWHNVFFFWSLKVLNKLLFFRENKTWHFMLTRQTSHKNITYNVKPYFLWKHIKINKCRLFKVWLGFISNDTSEEHLRE